MGALDRYACGGARSDCDCAVSEVSSSCFGSQKHKYRAGTSDNVALELEQITQHGIEWCVSIFWEQL